MALDSHQVAGRWPNGCRDTRGLALDPKAGFVFAALLFGAIFAGLNPQQPIAVYALEKLLQINIVWGIFNLMPMLPLDGGNIMRSLLGPMACSCWSRPVERANG